MLLTFDIGNTNITIGGYKDEKLVFTARFATDTRRTADQYAIEIRDILDINNVDKKSIKAAAICSVVPPVKNAIRQALKKLYNIEPLVLGPGVKTGLNIKIDNPAQLGADLAAGAVGAMAKYPTPTIIIDLGTATTISAIGKNGEFFGGAIAAGLRLTLEALTTRTAQLPTVSIEAPKSVIGTNTDDCMKSGIVIGAASMLDGMIDRIKKELGAEATVVATGGFAGTVVEFMNNKVIIDDNLLLDGLRLIYNKNNK